MNDFDLLTIVLVNPYWRADGEVGDRIELWSEGDRIAVAYSCLNTGRWTSAEPLDRQDATIHYRDWEMCLAEQCDVPESAMRDISTQHAYE